MVTCIDTQSCLCVSDTRANGVPNDTRRRAEPFFLGSLVNTHRMRFALLALRRERVRSTTVHTSQHVCFDWIIDTNWNVQLMDVSNRCTVQVGGSAYASECKARLVDASVCVCVCFS